MLHMDHFAQSLEHKCARELKVFRLLLAPSGAAWIPYGTMAIPTGGDPANTFRIPPWASTEIYNAMADSQKYLIRSGVLGFAKKNSEKNPWQRMLPAMTAFFG